MKLLIPHDSRCVDSQFGAHPQPRSTQASHPTRQMTSTHTRSHQAREKSLDTTPLRAKHRPHPAAAIFRQSHARNPILVMFTIAQSSPRIGPRRNQTDVARCGRRVQRVRAVARVADEYVLAILFGKLLDDLGAGRRFPVIHRMKCPPKEPMPLINHHMKLVAFGALPRRPADLYFFVIGSIFELVGLAIGEQQACVREFALDFFDDSIQIFDEQFITHASAHGGLVWEFSSPRLKRPVDAFARP